MARTKRAQILMEPEEYRRLEEIARRRQVSVAELIRAAVCDCYFSGREHRGRIVEEIFGMNLPVEAWDKTEEEISKAHDNEIS